MINREATIESADQLVARGKFEAALAEYRQLLARNPNDPLLLNRVGDLYARLGRISEASDLFLQIADRYEKAGLPTKAVAITKKVIKLDPGRLETYEGLAALYHRQGLVNEARTQYQVIADFYHKHENLTSEIAIYRKLAELEPENPSYHVCLAERYRQQGALTNALIEYCTIAEMMLSHRRPEDAADVYKAALMFASENLGFITDASLKLKGAGAIAAAETFLAEAIKHNPKAKRISVVVGLKVENPEDRVPEAVPDLLEAATALLLSQPTDEIAAEPSRANEPAASIPHYDVAISFAGEDRAIAEELAAKLKARNIAVFYDRYFKADLWGKDLSAHLTDVYGRRAKYCLLLISQHYATKGWTNLERRAAQARALEENREYILPIRLDATSIPGMTSNIGYLDIKENDIESIVRLVQEKLVNLK
ncbi:MAG TPA: TIR domain-containing protein [Thermoanaerobaculia bacterium]|nr:TIR domain-containing protein [Thermoanaerobaculia bacterium]